MADNGKIDVDGLPARPAGNLDSIVGVDKATRQAAQFPVTALPMPQGVVSAIQQQNTTIEAIRASQGSGLPSYATRAALPAPGTLPRPAGGGDPLVTVTNDSAPENNGAWRDTGSAWVKSADRVTGLESLTAGLDAKDALQRAVWQLPWLDPAMLTRFGGGSGDFDRPSEPHRLMVAKAIKDIQLDGADPAKQYRIITFSYGHVTNQDMIIVAATDGTAFATSGNVTFTKNPNGPTKVSFASGSNRVTAWIDYREITQTGILVNVTDSPLRIAKTSGHDLLRRRVDSAETLLDATTAVAASASASAAAEYGVFVVGLIPDGAYPAAMRAKVSGSIAEFHAAILDGAGTASVDVMVAGTVVASFTVTGDVTSPIATSIPEGGSVIFLISGASGITGLWVQITGESA